MSGQAREAIRRSAEAVEIVTIDARGYDEETLNALLVALLVKSSDSAIGDGVREFWGVTDEDRPWRVHVRTGALL